MLSTANKSSQLTWDCSDPFSQANVTVAQAVLAQPWAAAEWPSAQQGRGTAPGRACRSAAAGKSARWPPSGPAFRGPWLWAAVHRGRCHRALHAEL